MVSSRDGTIPFDAPGAEQPCETYYKIFGDLTSGKPALLALHGGPGGIHEYLLPLADLSETYGIPVVLYDQIGNGKSTHLRDKAGDTGFWTVALFEAELENLIKALDLQANGYSLLGHSWGGMLGATFATSRPPGLRTLILSNSMAAMAEWMRSEIEAVKSLPKEVADTLFECDRLGDTESERCKEARAVLQKKYVYDPETFPPPEMLSTFAAFGDDDTVNSTMQGNGAFTSGPLKDFTVVDRLHLIEVQTLVINGETDFADEGCNAPFFNHIPKVKWITLNRVAHMPMLEDRKRYMRIVAEFLGC